MRYHKLLVDGGTRLGRSKSRLLRGVRVGSYAAKPQWGKRISRKRNIAKISSLLLNEHLLTVAI